MMIDNRKNDVIIVEDDFFTRTVLTEALESEGYVVQAFKQANDALQYLTLLPAACIILLDLVMPQMDGVEFMEHLRSISPLNDVAVYIITASNRKLHISDNRPTGIIRKPPSFDYILAIVNRHCSC
jgi:CheY-like chemotaxis protein